MDSLTFSFFQAIVQPRGAQTSVSQTTDIFINPVWTKLDPHTACLSWRPGAWPDHEVQEGICDPCLCVPQRRVPINHPLRSNSPPPSPRLWSPETQYYWLIDSSLREIKAWRTFFYASCSLKDYWISPLEMTAGVLRRWAVWGWVTGRAGNQNLSFY